MRRLLLATAAVLALSGAVHAQSVTAGVGCQTCVSPQVVATNGAASTPAQIYTGTIFTGGTGTTTFPQLLVQPSTATPSTTWSTTGTAIGVDAHTGVGRLLDLQLDGTTEFNVSAAGAVAAASTVSASSVVASNSVQAGAAGSFNWLGRGAITSPGVGAVQLGATDAAAPVAQTLSAQSVLAGTSNAAGQNLTIVGSKSTGTGAGGSVFLQTAPAGTTGTAQNAGVTALAIDPTQFVTLGAGTPTCGTGCTSIGAGATNQRMAVTTSTAVTSIAVNFSKTLTTAPVCALTPVGAVPVALGFSAAPTATGFTIVAASALTAAVIDVTCL